jgi:hypothetical protein
MANGTIAASQLEMESLSGTGIITITPPATNTNRAITLPNAAGEIVTNSATQTLTNKTLTTPNINSAQVATVSGTAPLYMCRAWVNFNGTTSPGTIRASGNVSSVTRNANADYTVNFTTAMPDANFAVMGSCKFDSSSNDGNGGVVTVARVSSNPTASSVRINARLLVGTPALQNQEIVNVAIFR